MNRTEIIIGIPEGDGKVIITRKVSFPACDHSVIFLARTREQPEEDKHNIYKLCYVDELYFWLGLWSTKSTSGPPPSGFSTLREALMRKIKDPGWEVTCVEFAELFDIDVVDGLFDRTEFRKDE